MNDPEQNGAIAPGVGGLPILSEAVPWGWELHPIGRDDSTGERVFLLRLKLQTGPFELWAPAPFFQEMGEKIVAQAAGLQIAREYKPPTE